MAWTPRVLLGKLAELEIKKHLPVSPYWFSDEALASGLIHKVVYACAQTIASWRETIRESIRDSFLLDAEGEGLDTLGVDLELPRQARNDADYRQHMLDEIGRVRTTQPGMIAAIEEATGLEVSIENPWRQLLRWGHRTPETTGPDPVWGYGGTHVYGSAYNQAFVIDVVTIGYSVSTQGAAEFSAPAGARLKYTVKLWFPVLSWEADTHLFQRTVSFSYPVLEAAGTEVKAQRAAQRDLPSTPVWNHMHYDCAVSVEAFGSMTWAEALVGPINLHPSYQRVQSA